MPLTKPPRTPVSLLYRSLRQVLPGCATELARWRSRALMIPDPELRRQAVASLDSKRFHADAGAVYATAVRPGPHRDALIALIVAFQTISDYLDNLCDRSTSLDPDDFRTLHQAMTDAVLPGRPAGDYYARHPEKDDGGYLTALVQTCRHGVADLPGFAVAAPVVLESIALYTDLQVHKHVAPGDRVPRLTSWLAERASGPDALDWWEYAAATGSTLLVFALFLAATDPSLDPSAVRTIQDAYFPWICGLHILLDYFIDQAEDLQGGDLNFVAHYPSPEAARRRIAAFAERAATATATLPDPAFHRLVVDGLLGMYLSDPKVTNSPGQRRFARRLTCGAGRNAILFHGASRLYRLQRPKV